MSAETENRLGRALRAARFWADWTLQDLSKKAGVSASVISCAERGDRRLGRDAALRLFRVFPEYRRLMALWSYELIMRGLDGVPEKELILDDLQRMIPRIDD